MQNPLDALQLSELRKTLEMLPVAITAIVMVGVYLFNWSYDRSRFAWKCKKVFTHLQLWIQTNMYHSALTFWNISSKFVCFDFLLSRALGLSQFPYIHLPSRILLSRSPSVPSWPRNTDIPGQDLSLEWNSLFSRNTSSPRSLTGLVDCLKAFLLDTVGVICSAFFFWMKYWLST